LNEPKPTVAPIAQFMQRWLLRHSNTASRLRIKIDRRFADLTFAGDQYLNSGIAFS
jgi:hypothetical protein